MRTRTTATTMVTVTVTPMSMETPVQIATTMPPRLSPAATAVTETPLTTTATAITAMRRTPTVLAPHQQDLVLGQPTHGNAKTRHGPTTIVEQTVMRAT